MSEFASRIWSGFVSVVCVLALLVLVTAGIVASAVVKSSLWAAHKVGFAAGYSYERSRLFVAPAIKWLADSYRKMGDRVVTAAEDGLASPRVVAIDLMDGSYPNARQYDVNVRINGLTGYGSRDFVDGQLKYGRIGGAPLQITGDLVVALDVVDGVSHLLFPYDSPYSVIVYKGAAFDWNTVEPKVIEVFRTLFGWGNSSINITRSSKYDHLRDADGQLKLHRDRFDVYPYCR